MVGEDVRGVLVLQRAGHDIALRQSAPAQRALQLFDTGSRQQRKILLLVVRDIADPGNHGREIIAVDDHPPRAVGERKVLGELTIRQYDDVVPAHPALRPARVILDEVAQRIASLTDLADGVDGFDLAAVQPLQPGLTVMGDFAALDFNAHDARALDGDNEVDLVILEMIGDPLAGDHQVAVTELLAQGGPDTPFGGSGQAGVIGHRDGHR